MLESLKVSLSKYAPTACTDFIRLERCCDGSDDTQAAATIEHGAECSENSPKGVNADPQLHIINSPLLSSVFISLHVDVVFAYIACAQPQKIMSQTMCYLFRYADVDLV